jgi:hypothetical protein
LQGAQSPSAVALGLTQISRVVGATSFAQKRQQYGVDHALGSAAVVVSFTP